MIELNGVHGKLYVRPEIIQWMETADVDGLTEIRVKEGDNYVSLVAREAPDQIKELIDAHEPSAKGLSQWAGHVVECFGSDEARKWFAENSEPSPLVYGASAPAQECERCGESHSWTVTCEWPKVLDRITEHVKRELFTDDVPPSD